jgi:hypothetical protein
MPERPATAQAGWTKGALVGILVNERWGVKSDWWRVVVALGLISCKKAQSPPAQREWAAELPAVDDRCVSDSDCDETDYALTGSEACCHQDTCGFGNTLGAGTWVHSVETICKDRNDCPSRIAPPCAPPPPSHLGCKSGHCARIELPPPPPPPFVPAGVTHIGPLVGPGPSWQAIAGLQGAIIDAGGALFCVDAPQGLMASFDGGKNWDAVKVPRPVSTIDSAPSDPGSLYAQTFDDRTALVSRDGGRTWSDVPGGAASVPAAPKAPPGNPADPTDPTIVYRIGEPGKDPGCSLWRSTDAGTTFTQILASGSCGIQFWARPVFPPDAPGTVYEARGPGMPDGTEHIYFSSDHGATFTEIGAGVTSSGGSLVITPSTLFAGTSWIARPTR